MKKVLLVIATHGNEKIGVEVADRLKSQGLGAYFDVLVANPKALEGNVRFVERDLNRSYPGKQFSRFYEKRLAYKNINIAKRYRYVIDIHEASSGINDFIIIPREKVSRKFPLEFIGLDKVLLWPLPKGPLGQFLLNAIELEFGMSGRDRKEVVSQAEKVVKDFLLFARGKLKAVQKIKKETYYVYGKLLKDELSGKSKLTDFKIAKIENEEFYPLLVGQYLSDGIICYKMRKR